jgi:hypothetical protein
MKGVVEVRDSCAEPCHEIWEGIPRDLPRTGQVKGIVLGSQFLDEVEVAIVEDAGNPSANSVLHFLSVHFHTS